MNIINGFSGSSKYINPFDSNNVINNSNVEELDVSNVKKNNYVSGFNSVSKFEENNNLKNVNGLKYTFNNNNNNRGGYSSWNNPNYIYEKEKKSLKTDIVNSLIFDDNSNKKDDNLFIRR